MGEQMDGWPLSWRREGCAGWWEVVLEMEEEKGGDINLAEGMSLSVSLSLKTHTYVCVLTETHAATLLIRLARAAVPGQVKNSKE